MANRFLNQFVIQGVVFQEVNMFIGSRSMPEGLFIQTACCYEGGSGGRLYHENRRSIKNTLIERCVTLQDISYILIFSVPKELY